jgi:hypothetical protein
MSAVHELSLKFLVLGRYQQRPVTTESHLFGAAVASLGHVLVERLKDKPDVLVCLDWDLKKLLLLLQARFVGVRTVLIKYEPNVTMPMHKFKNPLGIFWKVLRVGDPSYDPALNWPVDWNLDNFQNDERTRQAVAINARKWSFHNDSLYGLRAKYFATSSNIDVFGPGWGEKLSKKLIWLSKELLLSIIRLSFHSLSYISWSLARPVNYRGTSQNKLLTLSKYKVSLVIENSSQYVSEKLVDSLLSGCVTVYVGGDPAAFGIPDDVYVRSLPSVREIDAKIREALEADSFAIRKRILDWAQNPASARNWGRLEAHKKMVQIIEFAFLRSSQ